MYGSEDSRVFLNIERQPYTTDEQECEGNFILDPDLFGDLERIGPAWNAWAIEAVERVVQAPAVIFRDLQRLHYDDAYCYSANISEVVGNDGTIFRNAPYAFLCFSKRFKRELIFFDWTYRVEDPGRHGWPANWGTDFGEPLWTPP